MYRFTEVIATLPNKLQKWASTLSKEQVASILTREWTRIECEKICEKGEPQMSSSYHLGAMGEGSIYNILKDKYHIEDVSKSGRCGDFIIIVDGLRILIEVKNYSKTVPTAEVEKFKNDISCNSSISGGIFVSHSKISNKRQTEILDVPTNTGNVPVAFVNVEDKKNSIDLMRDCLNTYIEIIVIRSRYNSQTFIGDDIENQLEQISDKLNNISLAINMVCDIRDEFNKKMNKVRDTISTAERDIKQAVCKMRNNLEISTYKDEEKISAINKLESCDEQNKQLLLELFENQKNIGLSDDNKMIVVGKTVCVKLKKKLWWMDIKKPDETMYASIPGDWSRTCGQSPVLSIVISKKNIDTLRKIISTIRD